MNPTIYFVLFLLLFSDTSAFSQASWSKSLPGVGTFSSPRTADLNRDGTQDIILGAGREEFQACDSAVIALDGKTGDLLWKVPAKDQIFGSAALKDISGDGIADVVIGGRSAELIAVDGRTGEVIWRFSQKTKGANGKRFRWFNFYNPQFIPDQNQDGLEDIIVSNGGDVKVAPYDPKRPPGYLLIIDSKTGQVISQAEMPDGKEIYMSIGVYPIPGTGDYEVVFGTGGETIGGNLYVANLSDVRNGDLSKAILLDSSPNKGYIGPPVRVDITGDGVKDIATCSVDGRLLTFDGKDHHRLWEVQVPNTESYTSLAVGFFTADTIPDFFLSFAQGTWPNLEWSLQKMVNGRTGAVEFTDSLGYYQNTSPLALDLNGDGRDEILMSLNYQEVDKIYQKFFYTTLIYIDFGENDFLQLGDYYQGSNFSSTPWAGDLDQDGYLDIIYCHGVNLRHTYTFDGIQINRIPTKVPVGRAISWGSYQGSDYNGIFKENK